MLAAVILPDLTTQAQPAVATESLGPTRHYIKTADICYGKSIIIVQNFLKFTALTACRWTLFAGS